MSDDRYALRIVGAGSAADPYRVVDAYEIDDDGEVEFEDDFLKRQLRFEGVLGAAGFLVYMQESYPWGVEVKVFRPLAGDGLAVNGQVLPLFVRVGEYKTLSSGGVVYTDDGYLGDRREQDDCTGSSSDDRFDCRGIVGKRAGVYWDRVSGGLGDDSYVIGKNSRSCYYDDNRKGVETFLYVDDFEFGDRFSFRRSSRVGNRYELRSVAGTSYETRLQQEGLSGVEMVLVAKNDRRDILACIGGREGQPLGDLSVSDLFG